MTENSVTTNSQTNTVNNPRSLPCVATGQQPSESPSDMTITPPFIQPMTLDEWVKEQAAYRWQQRVARQLETLKAQETK